MAGPETSVVIRTFNEEKHLPGLLEGIKRQQYSDYEIIVVDSGSVDRTPAIASARADKFLRIRSEDFTFGHSLNVGVKAASGRVVAIVSAHMLPVNETWLGTMVRAFRDEKTAMVYGGQRGAPTSKFSEARDFQRVYETRRRVLRPPNFFANNANSAILRQLWRDHPFDETLPGLEDIEWAKYWMERGYEVVYEPDALLLHIHEETWSQVRRRYYREAAAARHLGIKTRRDVVREVLRQGKHLVADFLDTSYDGNLRNKVRESFLFRLSKAWGTARGLLDGTFMADPAAREALFFHERRRAGSAHSVRPSDDHAQETSD